MTINSQEPDGISTHALREEGDGQDLGAGLQAEITISTHALREEGDLRGQPGQRTNSISTHALREEGDQSMFQVADTSSKFLPTPSARRAPSLCASLGPW